MTGAGGSIGAFRRRGEEEPRGGPAVVVAVADERGAELAADLRDAGAEVRLVVAPDAPAAAAVDAMSGREAAELLGELARADLLVLDADRRTLTAQLVAACDRFGIRIVALCAGAAERRLAGVFGVDAGTPILNPPEAGILGLGTVRRRPWEFEAEIALRDIVTLSLSFDHRLVDGEQGARFLAAVGAVLREPGRAMLLA